METGENDWIDQYQLSERQRTFVLAYVADPNAAKAATAAGYKKPETQGPRLLRNVQVAEAVRAGRDRVVARVVGDPDAIARLWWEIANADVRELVSHEYVACRYCWGIDHEFQWRTEREFQAAFDDRLHHFYPGFEAQDELAARATAREAETITEAMAMVDPRLPNSAGGFGYSATRDPCPACPECDGIGIARTRFADTRGLKGAALAIYDGMKETRQGTEIKLQDRSAALERLAKHLGMFAGKVAPEEVSPLEQLAQHLMQTASTVPVVPDNPQAQPGVAPLPEGFEEDDDEDVEP